MNFSLILPINFYFSVLVSFFVSYFLIPILYRLAKRFSFHDNPDGILKHQKNPIPHLGGVAIFVGLVASVLFFYPELNRHFLFYLLGITALFLVGMLDDFVILSPAQKLLGQIFASLIFIGVGLHAQFLWLLGVATSFFWFLLIINAINLVDVMDGLSVVIAICATFSFLTFATLQVNMSLIILLGSLLGGLLGFISFNLPPASIYMGDAGALFIGGILASVPFLINWCQYSVFGFLCPIIILLIPCFEVLSLVAMRFKKGIPFYLGSPDHFSIYLQKSGWSKNAILILIIFVSLLNLVVSVAVYSGLVSVFVVVFYLFLFVSSWIFMLHKTYIATHCG